MRERGSGDGGLCLCPEANHYPYPCHEACATKVETEKALFMGSRGSAVSGRCRGLAAASCCGARGRRAPESPQTKSRARGCRAPNTLVGQGHAETPKNTQQSYALQHRPTAAQDATDAVEKAGKMCTLILRKQIYTSCRHWNADALANNRRTSIHIQHRIVS